MDFLEAEKLTDLEFTYSTYEEMDDRLIISKKKNRESWEIFKGKAIIYHINGSVSLGFVKHNFLHGYGVRKDITEAGIVSLKCCWEYD